MAFEIPNPLDPNTPQAYGVTPAPSMSDAATPMRSPDQMNRPTPQMPMVQPTAPTAPTAAAPVAPVAPKASPQDMQAGIFHRVLGMVNGGNMPQRDAQGRPVTDANGNVQMQRGSTKQLGMGILAGAISGMLAGFGAPTQEGPGGNRPDYSAAVGAGAAAAQPFTQQGRTKQAQDEADAQRARQYATTDHNLKLHASLLANQKMQGDQMKEGVNDDSVYVDALKSAPPIVDENGKPKLDSKGQPMQLIMGQNITGDQLEQMMSNKNADGTPKDPAFHVTRESVLRDGVAPIYDKDHKPRMNPDGTPMMGYTYTVYNPEAQVALTQQMRDAQAKAGDNSLQYVAQGTMVPISVLAKGSRQQMEMTNAQAAVNQWSKQMADFTGKDEKKIDLRAEIQKNPYLRKLIPQLGAFSGMEPDQALAEMDKLAEQGKLDPSLVGSFSQLFGGIDRVKMAAQRADDVLKQKNKETEQKIAAEAAAKRATPEGQADLLHKKLENQQLEQALQQTRAAGEGLDIPKNFVANPQASEMPVNDLQRELVSKGVKVPPDFDTLYRIGHNEADIKTYTTNPRKGVPGMSRSQAMAFIGTYINPQYDEKDFPAAQALQKEYASTRIGTAGGTMQSAGVAAQHLQMLKAASDAMRNGDVQALNAIKQRYGIETGAKEAVVFAAIAQKVNTEVEKVVSGSAPMEAQLKEGKENLNRLESPDQVEGVIRSYIGLMNGRVGELDDRYMKYFGKHTKDVSPMMAKVFLDNGYTVPGQPPNAKHVIQSGDGKYYWTDGKVYLGQVK